MASNSYETGRLNLPFVGICTFGKYPYQPDWDQIDADVAILGAPFEPVLRGAAVLAVFWLILWWMYRRKIFLRI